jgi:predicted RNA binding protein YcfA (HicA-like mRNA interferase family)
MKLPVISGREMVKVLHRKGWKPYRQTGSHVIMQNADETQELSIPQHRELSVGIVHECIRVAGLTEDDF